MTTQSEKGTPFTKEKISTCPSNGSIALDGHIGSPNGHAMTQSQEVIVRPQDLENGPNGIPKHQVTHPTSYMETMLHLFRGNIGSGLLAMGDAFKNGGIIFSPIMTVALGIICVHAQHLLLDCSEDMHQLTQRAEPPGFADTVMLVFANGPRRLQPLAGFMRNIVNMFLVITQLGFCCVYIVFIANNMQLLCAQYDIKLDISTIMIVVIVPVLLACMVRNLKYLTPFSTIANIMMAIGVGAVIYEASQDLPPVSSRDYLAHGQTIPLYFATAVYAFEGIGLVLPLKSEMRDPKQFQKPLGVLNVGMVCVGSIFITVGFLGYLKWGDDVQGSLSLNLTPGQMVNMIFLAHAHDTPMVKGAFSLTSVVQGLIALAILFTYPLQFYVPIVITWPSLRRRFVTTSPVVKELIYRATLVLVTFALAESIPELGLFISLVGAISSTALALVFPPLIELVSSSRKPGGISYITVLKDSIIILLGMFIFLTGTYESIASIIRIFRLDKSNHAS